MVIGIKYILYSALCIAISSTKDADQEIYNTIARSATCEAAPSRPRPRPSLAFVIRIHSASRSFIFARRYAKRVT